MLTACTTIRAPEGGSGGAIVGDTLYIGTPQGQLLALDRASGQTLWRFELLGEKRERAIFGTPALDSDTLYVGGYDGVLYALSTGGELLGQEPLGGPIVGGPAVVDGVVLVGSSDGKLYALEVAKEPGRVRFSVKWRFPTEGKVWSSPAVAQGVVYFSSLDHNVYAVSLLDGAELWRFPTKGAVAATPVVAKGRVYVGSFDGVFYAINAATGREVWRFEGAKNWFWGRAAVAEDTIYAPSLDGTLYALGIDQGELRWALDTDGPIAGTPAVVLDMIAVPSADGKIRLVRLKDGRQLDACNIGEEIRTPLVEQGGVIYFGARDRSIRALRIKANGNPDEEWVHLTNKDDPLPRDREHAC